LVSSTSSAVPAQDPESLLAALSIAQQTASASASRFHRLDLAGTAVEAYRDDLAWVETVRHAVQEGRIAIHAQPIVPAAHADGGLHYEVLARMIDADGAIVPPARFLPALSQARLLEQFDQLVIATTLDHLASRPALLQATAVCAINVTGPHHLRSRFSRLAVACPGPRAASRRRNS
jgi:sensor c-di-GMP phosphodiesterase-like protein